MTCPYCEIPRRGTPGNPSARTPLLCCGCYRSLHRRVSRPGKYHAPSENGVTGTNEMSSKRTPAKEKECIGRKLRARKCFAGSRMLRDFLHRGPARSHRALRHTRSSNLYEPVGPPLFPPLLTFLRSQESRRLLSRVPTLLPKRERFLPCDVSRLAASSRGKLQQSPVRSHPLCGTTKG
jgi:hypothetical protein